MPLTCAHLVGSLPCPDVDTTFTEIGSRLGDHLERIPNGETGERARWIFWQRAKVAEHPARDARIESKRSCDVGKPARRLLQHRPPCREFESMVAHRRRGTEYA